MESQENPIKLRSLEKRRGKAGGIILPDLKYTTKQQ